MKRFENCILIVVVGLILAAQTVSAQSPIFNYQGSLRDGANPANGMYDFRFTVYSDPTGGSVLGGPVIMASTPVTNGIFTVNVPTGYEPFSGASRYLQVEVKVAGSATYTALNPRQFIASTPYSVKSQFSTDTLQLGGIAANQYITTTNGGANFIQNSTSQQTGNFNISGNGLFGGNLGIGTTTPSFRLDVVGRSRFRQNLGDTGATNTAGVWLFQNTPNQDRAFVGMETDNSVGFFGTNGGGWGLVMSTQTGRTSILQLGVAGATPLCRNASNEISLCSSSLRYKTNINPFGSGLDLISRLRPVSFNWLANNQFDFGLVAEEVAAVEPLLVTYNDKGEVEGVKYDRVGVVLVNAVKEQQAQIESQKKQIDAQTALIQQQQERLDKQQSEIEALKAVVCSQNPTAKICEEKKP